MALTLEEITGSELTIAAATSRIRKFRVKGTLPFTLGGDAFDSVASLVMGLVQTNFPTYSTPMGTLYWNSIQLHESFYALAYEISVTYSQDGGGGGGRPGSSGTYLIRIEHAAGTAQVTAGERIAGYPVDSGYPGESCINSGGTIFDGQEVVGVPVPFSQTRIVISYRHPQMVLNAAYLRGIAKLVGHPNNDTFLGYDPGEIAYAGGVATESEAEASAEYSFEVSRNITSADNYVVAGIAIAEKKGFDVISPIFKWDTDTDLGGEVHRIRPIHCIEIIRPAGREFKNYVSVFGWGGP